jgi:hypothetical protein
MIDPIVDTYASLDCVNEDDVILSLFPELFGFVCDLNWSWTLVWVSCSAPIQVTIVLW